MRISTIYNTIHFIQQQLRRIVPVPPLIQQSQIKKATDVLINTKDSDRGEA